MSISIKRYCGERRNRISSNCLPSIFQLSLIEKMDRQRAHEIHASVSSESLVEESQEIEVS